MQALMMQFGNDVGTSFLHVCADFGEYSWPLSNRE